MKLTNEIYQFYSSKATLLERETTRKGIEFLLTGAYVNMRWLRQISIDGEILQEEVFEPIEMTRSEFLDMFDFMKQKLEQTVIKINDKP